jgi:membrane protein DedA with SNARE-associated domain
MYLPRLTTISPKHFLVSNILGSTCWAVFITLIGIYGMHPPVAFWIIAVLAISIFFEGGRSTRKAASSPCREFNRPVTE